MFAPTSWPLVTAGLCSNMRRNKPFVENLDFQEHFISTTEFQFSKSPVAEIVTIVKKKSQSVIWKLNFELIQLYNGGVLN